MAGVDDIAFAKAALRNWVFYRTRAHAMGVCDNLVRIYIAQKLPRARLLRRERIPGCVDGVSVEVIESPRAYISGGTVEQEAFGVSFSELRAREGRLRRPLMGGISSAHHRVAVGTLGCFCRSTQRGDDPEQVFALSNNHVFAAGNAGLLGDDILQPSSCDGGQAEDRIGVLHRYVPIRANARNRVDAALAKLDRGISFVADIEKIGRVTNAAPAFVGQKVCKFGRSTGYTEGVVVDTSYDVKVGLDYNDARRTAMFENQMRIEPVCGSPAFATGGDSGALVVDKQSRHAVGLYFAGPPNASYGIANRFEDVERLLQITLL